MAKRALVVGSQIAGLKGADNDAIGMAVMLEARGFGVELRIRELASRSGILAGYDRLIAASTAGDAAVVYYAGHGFHAPADPQGRSWQCIVPTDLHSGGPTDWRGITAWELSIKQAQLTARTRNVTVILDACYAAQMSRDAAGGDAIARALPHPATLGLDHHLAWLRDHYGAAFGAVDPLGNRDAVRVVACRETETSFEYPDAAGAYHGAFTAALLGVLSEVGAIEISWAALGDAIRARVLGRFSTQRPLVEGPARRRLFSLVEDDDRGVVTVRQLDAELRLPVGALSGVTLGDVYGVMPVGSTAYDRRNALGEIEVIEVGATTARAIRTSGPAELPADAVAVPILRNAPKQPVAIDVPEAARDAVAQAIARARTLRIAELGEAAPVATLRLVDDRLTIEDAGGPLFPPARFPGELAVAIERVANLAAARALRALVGAHGVSADELEVELGVVERGRPRRLPDNGCALGPEDRVYVRITNRSRRQLHVHVFGVGIRGRVQLLTRFAPMGVALAPGGPPYTVGEDNGVLAGLALAWPEGLPAASSPRVDEIMVIAATASADLRGLEARDDDARGAGIGLGGLLSRRQAARGEAVRGASPEGFLIEPRSWLLHSRPIAKLA